MIVQVFYQRIIMSALVEFSMFPTEATQSKSAFVVRVLDIVDTSGYKTR